MSEEWVVLSDIHGNYPSLKAVVDKEGEDAEYVILGDIMGLLAYPKETLELVQEVGNVVLAGNHDKAIFHEGVGHVNSAKLSEFELSHTINNLTHEQIDWMRERPFMEVVQRGPSRIALCHAYPWPAKASGYEPGNAGIRKQDVPRIAKIVADDYDYVFHGHTHRQYDLDASRWSHDVHFVNPGTLGYDGTYSIVDTDAGTVEHRSVDYDEDAVQAHVQDVLPRGAPPAREWLS